MPRPLSNWRHLLPALALPYVLVMGSSAAPSPDTTKPFAFHDLNVLGTSLDMRVTTTSQKDAETAHAIALAEIERLRKILSTYDAASDISKVNATMSPVKVAPELIDVLKMYDTWQA